jgi:hypothetical protein
MPQKYIVNVLYVIENSTDVTVLDRNQAEQGVTGGSGPQLLASSPRFITRISFYSQLFSS